MKVNHFDELLLFSIQYMYVDVTAFPQILFFKKNQNAPRPSEHPPVRGKKCQNV